MAKTFHVLVTETLSRIIDVEAESESEAIEKAGDMYYNEKVVLDSSDFDGVEFTIFDY